MEEESNRYNVPCEINTVRYQIKGHMHIISNLFIMFEILYLSNSLHFKAKLSFHMSSSGQCCLQWSPLPGWGPSVKRCLAFLPQFLVSVHSSGCDYKCLRQGRYHHNNLIWIKPVTSFVLLCSLLRCLIRAESRHAIMFRFFTIPFLNSYPPLPSCL